LQAAHERGIVHRDFKPDNVFLVAQGDRADYVKLVDFGIAKLAASIGGGMTQPGTVMGTPAYMSPEQAAGETMLDARSDIYSLGVTMFQMATGKLPFADAGPSFGKILVAHLQQPPPRPRAIHPDVPEELEEILPWAKIGDASTTSRARIAARPNDVFLVMAYCLRGFFRRERQHGPGDCQPNIPAAL
jgi:serine/threonine-protein kinase